jgi:hypothetical protein
MMPTEINGQYFFTQAEQDELQGYFNSQNWAEAYRRTAEMLDIENGSDALNQVQLWFHGAYLVNTGQGAFSDIIRYYTERQGQLHFGEDEGLGNFAPYGSEMQRASNKVAEFALNSILTNIDGREGRVPLLSEIAVNDATAIGQILFERDPTDTAIIHNAAWSGAPLFSMLGNDQTGLLLQGRDNTNVVFDTIVKGSNLFTNLNFATESDTLPS